ncbi:piggyBac transposable element-derived protein 3-like [Anabrus simplex]|uniref:piggyBac transposable element-derived protein 3-like n=1 Tax=Anabrus simplex TaxID=316456 RepID=UPI0035A2AAD3
MMHLAGVHVMMGVLGYPQTKMYWQRDTEVPIISKCMSRDRFFELRNFMHFVDNQGEHEGPLWKVKPFLDCVKQKCISLPRSKHVSLDEQMVPFSGKCGFRQFVPSKPNPSGLKNFILAAPDGLVLDFMFYTGAGTVSIEDQKEYGLGGAIVKVLTESIPQDKTHCVYTDRFFTSVKSVDMLLQRNIYQTGTVMKNRVGSVSQKLKTDKELKRGEWEEWVREDEKMCIVKWKDNRSVLLLSSCVGSEPPTTCKRWSKEEKRKVVIPQPLIVKYYNEKMGGVDLCDRFMSYYRCYIRTNKWPVRMFNHFVDLIIVNCWIMYHRWCAGSGIIRQKRLSLMDYKMHVGKALINFKDIGYINIRKRGRPPSASTNPVDEDDDSEDDMDKQGTVKVRRVQSQPIPELTVSWYLYAYIASVERQCDTEEGDIVKHVERKRDTSNVLEGNTLLSPQLEVEFHNPQATGPPIPDKDDWIPLTSYFKIPEIATHNSWGRRIQKKTGAEGPENGMEWDAESTQAIL